jgi:hypothetical protein
MVVVEGCDFRMDSRVGFRGDFCVGIQVRTGTHLLPTVLPKIVGWVNEQNRELPKSVTRCVFLALLTGGQKSASHSPDC